MANAETPIIDMRKPFWRCILALLCITAISVLWQAWVLGQELTIEYREHTDHLLSGIGREQHCRPLRRPLTNGWYSRDGGQPHTNPSKDGPPFNALEELHYALETMQDFYFQLWLGKWPTSIDWTAAVMGTYVSAALFSLTRSLEYVLPPAITQPTPITIEGEKVENEVNKYFSQSVAFYFGEEAFSIRLQAYDDMLWVVLGWLEGVRFIKLHTNAHYPGDDDRGGDLWHGKQFVPAFAHRARIFYDLASQGWDTKLCGGGMTWNPHLTPYKNAITNELYISASMGMYLYFPGDPNPSPYAIGDRQNQGTERAKAHDPLYLSNAIKAYKWLKRSNMTNDQGLYVDGFHIAGWDKNGNIGTGNCDVRNEMVYTYNQGVLLSGLRGLWEGTGELFYLKDGHKLVRNVIKATGWKSPTERTGKWSGLGRNGILEEICDVTGKCSQNSQTFKGIFFHHLTLFCEPLPEVPLVPGKTYTAGPTESSLHAQSCREYAAWVAWNARAAMSTRNREGRFGMWWGADRGDHWPVIPETPEGAEDYRNEGLGDQERWGSGWDNGLSITPPREPPGLREPQSPILAQGSPRLNLQRRSQVTEDPDFPSNLNASDLNDRGRGRTVETQGGGVAVLRAMWEFVNMYSDRQDLTTVLPRLVMPGGGSNHEF